VKETHQLFLSFSSSFVKDMTKTIVSIILILLVVTSVFQPFTAYSQASRFVVLLNQSSYAPGDILVVYGKVLPNDSLIVRILDPEGKTIRIDAVTSDENGSITSQVFQWPQPTRNFVYGRYNIEVSSSIIPTDKKIFTVEFGEFGQYTGPFVQTGSSLLAIKLDSPTQISVNQPFRIFVQITFDGALVNAEPSELLASSHIHSGNSTINLVGTFHKLHEGIYYADVTLDKEDQYIIHAIAFHRGFLAHDSKVVTSGGSIVEIQQSVNSLKVDLESTRQGLAETQDAIDQARDSIKEDIGRAEGAVNDLILASGQINSIIIPILALIAIVIALQISLFARIRASFK
jgi:hypothetical protein